MTTFSPNYLDYLLLAISAEKGITEATEDLLNFCKLYYIKIFFLFAKKINLLFFSNTYESSNSHNFY